MLLAGISAYDLEIILDFIYKGEIKISSDKLPSLLQAAQLLDVRALSPAALVLKPTENTIPLVPAIINEVNSNLKYIFASSK